MHYDDRSWKAGYDLADSQSKLDIEKLRAELQQARERIATLARWQKRARNVLRDDLDTLRSDGCGHRVEDDEFCVCSLRQEIEDLVDDAPTPTEPASVEVIQPKGLRDAIRGGERLVAALQTDKPAPSNGVCSKCGHNHGCHVCWADGDAQSICGCRDYKGAE